MPRIAQIASVQLTSRNTLFLFPGPTGGGVSSGEMNQTIQQFLGSFARESLGTPRNSIVFVGFFYCVEIFVGLLMILFAM